MPMTSPGIVDFPNWVTVTRCKTHTHRAIDHDSKHGMSIYNLTYNDIYCNGNVCKGYSPRYASYTIVR